jgi:hypothetical protein
LVKLIYELVTITKLHPNKLKYGIKEKAHVVFLNFVQVESVADFARHGMPYDGFPGCR